MAFAWLGCLWVTSATLVLLLGWHVHPDACSLLLLDLGSAQGASVDAPLSHPIGDAGCMEAGLVTIKF